MVVTVLLLPCIEAQASVFLLSFCFDCSSSDLCLCFVPLWLLSFWSILLLFLFSLPLLCSPMFSFASLSSFFLRFLPSITSVLPHFLFFSFLFFYSGSFFFIQSPSFSFFFSLFLLSVFFFSFSPLSQSILPSISHPPSLFSLPFSIIGRGRETHPVLSSHGTR